MTVTSTLTIRAVDPELKARLRVRAAEHGNSMEEEVRRILRDALLPPVPRPGVGSRIRARFAEIGGVELEAPDRGDPVRPADLG